MDLFLTVHRPDLLRVLSSDVLLNYLLFYVAVISCIHKIKQT